MVEIASATKLFIVDLYHYAVLSLIREGETPEQAGQRIAREMNGDVS